MNTMECTKSNVSSEKKERKNVYKQLFDLWKEDTNWENLTQKDKRICIVFCICIVLLLVFGHTVIAFPAIIGLAYNMNRMKKINVEE